MTKQSIAILFTIIALRSPLCVAQDYTSLDIEDLMNVEVVAVSRSAETVRNAPANITVITARQIREWGARDLKDILRRVVGYDVIADRDEWVFSARGNVSDNNQKYLILIDGHRMNSIENFGPGQIIELPNDLSNVKRIEIIRGPGSAVWGSAALAGVINIVTKTARDLGSNKTHVSTTVGEDNTYKANFQTGEVLGDHAGFIIMGSYSEQKGRNVTQSAATTLPIFDRESGHSAHPYGTYTTALERREPGYMLQLKGYSGKFSINAFAFSTDVHNRHFEVDQGRKNYLSTYKTFIEGTYENTFFSDMALVFKISSDHNRAEYFPEAQGGATKEPFNIVWLDRGISTSLGITKPLGNSARLNGGLEFTSTKCGPNQRINSFNANAPKTDTTGFWFDPYLEDETYGGYLILELMPLQHLRFTAGSWVDYNDDRGTDRLNVGPRLAAIWQPEETSTVKLLYNRAFLRPANFQSAGAEVESEIMDQMDLIFIQQIGPADLITTLYWQELTGFINILSGADYKGFANAGDYESKGIEMELWSPLGDHHSLWANARIGEAEGKNLPDTLEFNSHRTTPDGDLLSYPEYALNAGATFRLSDGKYFVSPALRYVGAATYRETPAMTATLDDAEYAEAGPFTYLDVNFGYEPNQRLGFYLGVHNILDETDPTHLSIWNGTIEQYGRYAEAKVCLKW